MKVASSLKEVRMYLLVVSVPNERDQRMKVVFSLGEAATYVMKLKTVVSGVQASVYALGKPCETFT